jgi:hypothetical protein
MTLFDVDTEFSYLGRPDTTHRPKEAKPKPVVVIRPWKQQETAKALLVFKYILLNCLSPYVADTVAYESCHSFALSHGRHDRHDLAGTFHSRSSADSSS